MTKPKKKAGTSVGTLTFENVNSADEIGKRRALLQADVGISINADMMEARIIKNRFGECSRSPQSIYALFPLLNTVLSKLNDGPRISFYIEANSFAGSGSGSESGSGSGSGSRSGSKRSKKMPKAAKKRVARAVRAVHAVREIHGK